jgi:protein-S-isoprenylcysteine O-methyltransferase Ste14
MTLLAAKWIWFFGLVCLCVIRYPHERRSRRTPTIRRLDRQRENVLLGVVTLTQGILPAFYVLTNRPAFANYSFQPALAWFGTAVLAGALYLFYRAHHDLGRNWSVTLAVREQHTLVTTGIYRRLRHPMYSAFFLAAVAQALLLPNWIAGPAAFVGFGTLFFGRLWREERMMIETFGDEYRRYMARTSRIIPGIF